MYVFHKIVFTANFKLDVQENGTYCKNIFTLNYKFILFYLLERNVICKIVITSLVIKSLIKRRPSSQVKIVYF